MTKPNNLITYLLFCSNFLLLLSLCTITVVKGGNIFIIFVRIASNNGNINQLRRTHN